MADQPALSPQLAVPDGLPLPQRTWAILTIALGLTLALIFAFAPFPGAAFVARVIDTFIALPTFLVTLAFTFLYGSAGILNGANYNEWDPRHDPLIAAPYSADDLSGKEACKRALLAEFGLPDAALDRPLIGIVSRFTRQKGADILAEVAAEIAAADIYVAALGSGDPEYEAFFQQMAADHPDRIALRLGYDDGLAHRIEAGADMFLMPSHYEPCGLNQMYSLRYGTVPVVRATGGLDDTIDESTGFKFTEYTGQALLGAVLEAAEAFSNRTLWREMMRRGMQKDFSWKASAAGYSALYQRLAGGA